MTYTHTNRVSARFIAVLTVFSMLMSALPAPLFVPTAKAVAPDKVDICHATNSHENPYNSQSPNESADVSGHDAHDGPVWYEGINEDWGDIIPPFDYDGGSYPGKNWTEEGQEIFNNDCEIPEESVDFCDPSQKPGGMSIAAWHEANDFDNSTCFDYEVDLQCSYLDVDFTRNDTPYDYSFYYALGDETPELADWDGDGPLPVTFDEDENGGSVDLTYYVVGPESDFFAGSSIPNIWEGNGTTVAVNTDCEEETESSEIIVVTDDTTTSGAQPEVGWMFNRDPGNQTPFEFNDDEASIGDGSLFVEPITNTVQGNSDKFIGELFFYENIEDVESISYDFKLGAGSSGEEAHFYGNAYITLPTPNSWYDCRYDIVPTTGSTSGFTTITFDPDEDYSVTSKVPGSYVCPSSPSDMPDGSSLNFFAINVGDTSANDTGVSGYLDKVVTVVDQGSNIHTTTYDFEPKASEVTVVTKKVICEDEADLPNWQDGGGANITANTASDWVAQHDGCYIDPTWHFQWYPDNILHDGVGDDTFTGPKGNGWSETFTGTTTIDITNINDLSFREVLEPGYIPFTYLTEGKKNTDNVTAEFNCSTGGKNYDNLEWARDVEDGDVIQCVAFNVPVEVDLPSECEAGDGFADSVFEYSPGTQKDGGALPDNRDDAGNALGEPEDDDTFNFVSLGIGGELILEFDYLIEDKAGDDFQVVETSFGSPAPASYPETAEVWVSDNGTDFEMVGTATLADDSFDLSGTSFDAVRFIKLVDTTDPDDFSSGDADGFDLDGIRVINCDAGPEEPEVATVTMCKIDENEEPLEGWTLMLKGDHLEDLVVPANSSSGVNSSVLVDGAVYIAKVVGTWFNAGGNGGSGNTADAEYVTTDNWASHTDGPPISVNNLDLQIAEQFVSWGTFNPLHSYALPIIGGGIGVNFRVFDGQGSTPKASWYSDNEGSLDVSIHGGYVGVTGENGCVVFDEVPYGDYTVDEIPQDGWYNLSGLGDVVVDEENETFYVMNSDQQIAPYCGDGEVNQKWEQCELGDDNCTDQCLFDNQCTATRLAKITFDENESVSFDNMIYLGTTTNAIPSGTWFNLDETGDANAWDIADEVDGLAVQRNTIDETVLLAFRGGNARKDLDKVIGDIELLGAETWSASVVPSAGGGTGYKLETPLNCPGANCWHDVFDVLSGNQLIDFDLRADTGNDGVTFGIRDGDEYNCPTCLAGVEARIIVEDTAQNGEGDWSDEIILGDDEYSTVEFGEWFPISVATTSGESAEMINDPNTVTGFASPGDKPGLFVSREDGTVKVALYGFHNPGGDTNYESINARIEVRDAEITNYQEMIGDYKFENHPEDDAVTSNDGFDNATADNTGVDFNLWVDTKADGFKFDIARDTILSCDEDTEIEEGGGNGDEDLYEIYGYVWHDEDRDTDWGEDENDRGDGLLVTISDDEGVYATTTTDEDGFYSFLVPAGTWTITEDPGDGWEFTTDSSHEVTVPEPEELSLLDTIINFIIPTAHAATFGEYSGPHNFGNAVSETITTDSSGGGGGGGSASTRRSTVAGASTSNFPDGLVLGDQVSVVPAGAPNAGAGGAASQSWTAAPAVLTLSSLLAFMILLRKRQYVQAR